MLNKQSYVVIFIVLILTCFVFLPISLPYEFTVNGKIFPIQEWRLESDADGNFFIKLVNNKTGRITNSQAFRFERGDVSSIELNPNFSARLVVHKHDSIARINSFLLEQELAELNNDLAEAKSALVSENAGAKPPLVQDALRRIDLAKQNVSFQELQFTRTKYLFNENVVSEVEFQVAENRFKSSLAELSIAENELVNVQTGVKPEAVKFLETTIQNSQREIEVLQAKKNSFEIVSPISGRLNFSNNRDNIVVVEDTSAYILLTPIKYDHREFVNKDTEISLSLPYTKEEYKTSFYEINDKVKVVRDQQIYLSKSIIEDDISFVNSGLVVQCKVTCSDITLLEYAGRILSQLVR